MAGCQPDLRAVFCEAFGRKNAKDQADYLERACQGRPELRARVEALLRANDEASRFLQEGTGAGSADMWKRVDPFVQRFEQAWQTGTPPALGDFLPPDGPDRPAVLKELVKVDMERRIKAGAPARAEDYLERYPELAPYLQPTRVGELPQPGQAFFHESAAEKVGMVVAGRYKLLEQIGEGGMGTVWVAEQTQPVRRKVALKLIKAGMDSKSVLARFEAERQALALMDHPNIAKVLDGGTTESGRPFFVMEYVKGIPFTKYCTEMRLTIQERLALFVPVCHAVQHAHQKGLIHRDLKPSNILVCLYDGVPVPKVIDFGLAKAMHQPLTEHTLHTAHGTMMGTPAYMSPEQAELNNLDVDIRSDVYSLGVILYELLTGTTPLERKRLKDAAWQEMLRLIKEEEPPTPSKRVSTLGEDASVVSAQRKSDPKRLSRLFRGELDWIVMKALDKDRRRRFETVTSLTDDIQRYLANEPVLAGPPTARYRLRKFARRHRVGLVLTTVIALAFLVVVITVAGSVGLVIGERSARAAEITRRVRDAIRLGRELAGDNRVSQASDQLKVAQQIIVSDRAALPALAAEVDGLAKDLGGVKEFQALIDRAHNTETTSLGYSPQRGNLIIKALAFYGVLERDDWFVPLEKSALGKQTVKQIRHAVYEELVWLADHAFAWWYDPRSPWTSEVIEMDPQATAAFVQRHGERAARQALDYLRLADRAQAPTPSSYRLRAQCQQALSGEAAAQKDLDLASQTAPASVTDFYLQGLALARKSRLAEAVEAVEAGLRLEPGDFSSRMLLGYCLLELGRQDKQKAEAAVSTYGGCLSQRPRSARAYFERGLAQELLGRKALADNDFAKAKEFDSSVERTFVVQGDAYSQLRQWDKAIAEYSKAVEATAGKQYLPERGRAFSCATRWDEAIADYSRAGKEGNWELLDTLAVIFARQGRPERVLALASEHLERNAKFASAWEQRGELYGKLGQWDKALEDFTQAIKLYGAGKQPLRFSVFNSRAVAYAHLGKIKEAKDDFAQAVVLAKGVGLKGATSLWSSNALWVNWASQGYYKKELGLFEKVCAELRKAIESQPDNAFHAKALAWILVSHPDPQVRDPRQAVELAKKAVALKPEYWESWMTLGAAHYRQDDSQEACTALKKSIELSRSLNDGGNGYQCFFLAMAYWKLGQRDEARTAYLRGVEWMSSLPNNVWLLWWHGKGPDALEIRVLQDETADLLGFTPTRRVSKEKDGKAPR
jgi:serine/threonine protein kinase/tetratricopeptide (TPR) repeat protein